MRVIAGEKRGLKLSIPKGEDIRPTTDKIKGAIFNTLQWDLPDADVFVDCFGGSGAMAIEALSRGVREAYIFDASAKSIQAIQDNVKKAHYENRAHVMKIMAQAGIDRLSASGIQADFVFMDPPYRMKQAPVDLMMQIVDKKMLKSTGIVVIEHAKSVIMPVTLSGLRRVKQKHYGITSIDYYRREDAS